MYTETMSTTETTKIPAAKLAQGHVMADTGRRVMNVTKRIDHLDRFRIYVLVDGETSERNYGRTTKVEIVR